MSLLRIHFWGLFFFFFVLLLLFLLGINIDFSSARDLALALVVLLVGLNMNLSEQKCTILVKLYIALYAFAALSIVFVFASGFIIHDQYLPVPKNQLAPAFGTAFILSMYYAFWQRGPNKWFYFIFAVLLFASVLVIRGRAVIFSIFIIAIIFVVYFIRDKRYRIIIMLFVFAIAPFIGQYVYDAMFLNYDVYDVNSIASGRSERNMVGLDFFFDHILFGSFEDSFVDSIIHNYVLISLVEYGVLLGSVVLCIYFKYILTIIKAIKRNTFQYFEVGPLVMVILIVISFFEYTYPYAPGSSIFFPFFLMGQYLKRQ